jgi:hypothetical protein
MFFGVTESAVKKIVLDLVAYLEAWRRVLLIFHINTIFLAHRPSSFWKSLQVSHTAQPAVQLLYTKVFKLCKMEYFKSCIWVLIKTEDFLKINPLCTLRYE